MKDDPRIKEEGKNAMPHEKPEGRRKMPHVRTKGKDATHPTSTASAGHFEVMSKQEGAARKRCTPCLRAMRTPNLHQAKALGTRPNLPPSGIAPDPKLRTRPNLPPCGLAPDPTLLFDFEQEQKHLGSMKNKCSPQ